MSIRTLKFARHLVAAAGLSLLAQGAFAATMNGTATIIQPIAITSSSTLAFGNILADATNAGTVVISPVTGASTLTGVTRPGSAVGTISAASFTVTGASGLAYAVSFGESSVTLSDGGNNRMTMSSFTTSSANNFNLTGGSDTLKLGGTLAVGAAQAPANYSGSVSVTVAYN
jgi:hypothetical protein